ncbi:MAG: alkaline phosphatase family protein [Stellaceae bacterium]
MRRRALLIGLDGATFTILDRLIEQGIMPFLQNLLGAGTRAELISVVPPLTPPAWTSLTTGRRPGNHGIFDFMRLESRADGRYLQVSDSRAVSCETIWSIATRHGLRATVLNFPLTYPAPPISGYVVPGWVPWRHLRLACHPADLYDRIRQLPGFDARELAMDMSLEGRALEGPLQADDYEHLINLHIRRERQWLTVLRHLMKEQPCELTAILFDGVDKLQHFCWRFLDPALYPASPSPMEAKIRNLCLEYFREIDRFLEEIVTRSGSEATVVIASDHGFGATTEIFYVNAWLHQQGYLHWIDAAQPERNHRETLGLETMARRFYAVDWDRTVAYCPTPSSNGIYFSLPKQAGAVTAQYQELRRTLIASLLGFTDPATGRPVVTRVWTREEAFAGTHMGAAPDLTLRLRDGGFVSILPSDVVLKPRSEPAGTHRPQGIFVAMGPGIRRGASVPALSILDIAPTLLYALGLPVPADFEGRVPQHIFERSYIEANPVVRAAPTRVLDDTERAVGTMDTELETEVIKQLKALGYLE